VTRPLSVRLLGEALGSALLLAVIVGSGIMAERLAGGNLGIALLANSLATGAGLAVLILVMAPVSGAHFNPLVTLLVALRGEMRWPEAGAYAVAQVAGAVAGVVIAHLMFDLTPVVLSATARSGPAQMFAEAVATFGLMLTITGTVRSAPAATPFAVGLYIVAAFWFTASTSFANPAVTIARALTDTFAGIAPNDVPAFIAAQLTGAFVALPVSAVLWPKARA
jgi:glycerol uptake facilitator-like aquaporin